MVSQCHRQKKPMSGAKKTEAQKKAELEAIMQMSPSSKAKALEKRAARQAAAQRAADTRKKRRASEAESAPALSETEGDAATRQMLPAAAEAAAVTATVDLDVEAAPRTPEPGRARSEAGSSSAAAAATPARAGTAKGRGRGRGQGRGSVPPKRLAQGQTEDITGPGWGEAIRRAPSSDSMASTLALPGTASPVLGLTTPTAGASEGDDMLDQPVGLSLSNTTPTRPRSDTSTGAEVDADQDHQDHVTPRRSEAAHTPAAHAADLAEVQQLVASAKKEGPGSRHPAEGRALAKQALPREPASFSADTVTAEFLNSVQKNQKLIFDKWPDLATEEPLGLTEGDVGCGIAEPVTLQKFKVAMKTHGRHVGAHNFFAHNIIASAVTGVPVRQQAIDEYCRVNFKEPRHEIRPITIAVPSLDWDPFQRLGSWLRLSPEELPAALLQAVALDIEAGMPEARLEKWNHILRSTMYEFVLAPSQADQFWKAIQLREDITLTSFVVARTFLQRCLELQRFKARFLPNGTSASAPEVVNAYAKNVRQSEKANPDAAVTLSFVQNCDKVFRTMLADSAVASLLLEVDCAKGREGPFNSHTKLAEICSATKQDPEKILRVLQGILYRMTQQILMAAPSINDLRGNSARGSGLIHLLLLLKLELKNHLLKRTLAELHMDSEFWSEVAAPKFASHRKFELAYKSQLADLSWTSGLKKHDEDFLAFMAEVVFGTRWDSQIRFALKQGSGVAGFLNNQQVKETLAGISATRDELDPEMVPMKEPDDSEAPCAATTSPLVLATVTVRTQGSTDAGLATSKNVAVDSLDKESYEVVGSYHERVANLYRAHVTLATAQPETLREVLLSSPAGKIEGCKGKNFNKYVVVLLDHKLLGEAASRPLQRLPAFSQDEVFALYEAVRSRFEDPSETSQSAPAEQETLRTRKGPVAIRTLPEGDLYCVLDGGRDGGDGKPLFYFTGRSNKVIRKFMIHKTQASATSRMQRVKPTLGSMRLTETLYVISKVAPKVPVTDFVHYPHLNSGGDCIGPVKLPKPDEMWTLPWPIKKEVLEGCFRHSSDLPEIPDDAEESQAQATSRASNSAEPVFFHALPTELFEDVYRMTQAVAVIDLTAGDGAAAVAAVKHRLLYFGLTLTTRHQEHLAAHIKKQLLNAMATEGDSLYEPALVAALLQEPAEGGVGDSQDGGSSNPNAKKGNGKGKGKPKKQPGKPAGKAAGKAAAKAPLTEEGEEGVGGGGDQEPAELDDPFDTEL